MTPARDLRDRVAEALRGYDLGIDAMNHPSWSNADQRERDFWRGEADDLIATLDLASLAIVEKDAPHG